MKNVRSKTMMLIILIFAITGCSVPLLYNNKNPIKVFLEKRDKNIRNNTIEMYDCSSIEENCREKELCINCLDNYGYFYNQLYEVDCTKSSRPKQYKTCNKYVRYRLGGEYDEIVIRDDGKGYIVGLTYFLGHPHWTYITIKDQEDVFKLMRLAEQLIAQSRVVKSIFTTNYSNM